ncbi:MAG: ATP-binding protein [Acidobacteria bacterium]|nr:ATP-binding protein [Acidobacteriota bacterium]
MPPHLAGREREFAEFDRLLDQDVILENMVLTGLRGVGKTVLLDMFRPRAVERGWRWVGTDLSESASVSESRLATRLLADLSLIAAGLEVPESKPGVGFSPPGAERRTPLTFDVLGGIFQSTPGLVADKIKAALEFVWESLGRQEHRRVIFAYDEAQNLSDYAGKEEYPLSLLLDVFQSIQKKGIPFMLILTGLPTLFPKLVDARTFAERMFRVVTVGKLTRHESEQAILRPIEDAQCPVRFSDESVGTICDESAGYPYFIQFICREVFDIFIQQAAGGGRSAVPVDPIQRKLDADFFAGRWARVTDRQRQLLWVIASLDHPGDEFTIQELVARAKELLDRPFSPSHANQMLAGLAQQGLIYKNRFGRYSFAVPLLGKFIRRTYDRASVLG